MSKLSAGAVLALTCAALSCGVAAQKQSVRVLINKLRKGSEPERVAAAIDIGLLGSKGLKAVPDLLEAIVDGADLLRGEAARAVGRIGKKAVPKLRRTLQKSRGDELRIAALQAIAKLGDEAIPLMPLMHKLWLRDRIALSEAISATFVALGERSVPQMIKGVEDFAVRDKACRVLERLGKVGKPAIPALRKMLQGKAHGRCDAVAPLVATRDPAVIPDLVELLIEGAGRRSRDDGTAYAAAMGIGKFGPAAAVAVPALLELAESDKSTDAIRTVAAESLGDVGVRSDAVKSRLRDLARRPDASKHLRNAVARSSAVLEMSDSASSGVLASGIRHQSVGLRLRALELTAQRGAKMVKHLEAITKVVTSDPEIACRIAGLAALLSIGKVTEQVIAAIDKAAAHPDKQLAAAARETRTKIGKLEAVGK